MEMTAVANSMPILPVSLLRLLHCDWRLSVTAVLSISMVCLHGIMLSVACNLSEHQ